MSGLPAGGKDDPLDLLGRQIVTMLRERGGAFPGTRQVGEWLTADGFSYTKGDLPPAMERLRIRGEIDWPEVARGRSRPGRLADPTLPSPSAEPSEDDDFDDPQ